MKKYFILSLILMTFAKLEAQSLFDYSGNEYSFGFYMIPKQKKSIYLRYHATDFRINSDSTFNMGMSEAAESGTIRADSTLSMILYDYNSSDENKIWAESFKIIYCSENFVVLVQKNTNYDMYFDKYKGFGDIWHIYSRDEIGFKKEAKKLYKKLNNEHNMY